MKAPAFVKKLVFEINYSCTSCDMCLAVCPTGSIFIGHERYVIDTDTCDAHGICQRVCPVYAIVPREIEVEADAVSRDDRGPGR